MTVSNYPKTSLHELGYKIFLDRYAQKDMTRSTFAVGDLVIVVVDEKTGQREIGEITAMDWPQVTVKLFSGEEMVLDYERVDKPLETDPSQMIERVAKGIASVEATPELRELWTERFQWVLEDWKFVPGGRILTAAGTNQELTLFNCYVIPSPHDSRSGIIETLGQMTEIMSRGGGVGINLSSLRPRHAYVRGVNGRSSGSVSWGALYSFVTGLIEQGGSRRGALMLILNDWHPDVSEFINSKRVAGRITNANISVGVSDKLMEAVKNDSDWQLVFPDINDPRYDKGWDGNLEHWIEAGGKVIVHETVKARQLWNTIIESAWASAEPGIWFRERAEKMSNSWFFNPLIATNPCLTGDTRVYTSHGLVRMDELVGRDEAHWIAIDNRMGRNASSSSKVFCTGIKPVYRVQTREGYYVRATADHKIMTSRGWVEVQDLAAGDHVHILNHAGLFGKRGSLEEGRLLGWLIGDGVIKSETAVLSFFGEEKEQLAPLFASYTGTSARAIKGRDEVRVQSAALLHSEAVQELVEEKLQVPESVYQGRRDMQKGFLQALFTADGSFQDGGNKGASIRLASNSTKLLEGVQQLLLNFGIASRIYRNRREAGWRDMPNSKRELQPYWCESQHELAITKRNMNVFASEIGFLLDRKQQGLEDYITRAKRGTYSELFIATIESVTADGEEAVYDLTEPITHSFIANGMVVHNCGEQSLAAWSVCNLGAINLARFYDEQRNDVAWESLRETARYATRFLDNVIDATPYFYDENEKQQKLERRVGLNTMGIAELMIKLGIRYGSEESIKFIDKLYEFLATEVYKVSAELAHEKGAFPAYDGDKFLQGGFMQTMPEETRELIRKYGIRNVTLLTQAPNGTTGTMVNTSTGIEPFFSWVYYRKSRLGLHEEQVPLVKEWYEKHPGETKLPDYFVTAMELSPEEHVRVQAAIQRWVDSSISKTCNVPNNYTVEQVRQLYEYMYELGCKGGTIYRDGSRDEQVLMLKGEEKQKESKETTVDEQAVAPLHEETPHTYPRPEMLKGVTMSRKTPFGTAYITINTDEFGCPFEVFITIGKAGSDLQADAEGLGRIISLQLRTTAPQYRKEMLKLVIEQLRGIGGTRATGFGAGRVISLPDAVGAVLEKFVSTTQDSSTAVEVVNKNGTNGNPISVEKHSNGNGNGKAHSSGIGQTHYAIPGADMCPSCGTISLVRAEGCRKCLTCGYSEC